MDPAGWKISPRNYILHSSEVHLWRASIPENSNPENQLSPFWDLLSEDEQTRAKRFQFDLDRIQFSFCRGLLRTLSGRYLQISPQEIFFDYGPQGKPYLVSPQQQNFSLQFNLSHSHGKLLLAFSSQGKVGVDLEKIKEKNSPLKLAERYFTRRELEWLKAKSLKSQAAAFYQLWTLKEAYLKAEGVGLSQSLKDFQILFQGEKISKLASLKEKKEDLSAWHLESLKVFPDYAAAVATIKSQVDYKFFDGERFIQSLQFDPLT